MTTFTRYKPDEVDREQIYNLAPDRTEEYINDEFLIADSIVVKRENNNPTGFAIITIESGDRFVIHTLEPPNDPGLLDYIYDLLKKSPEIKRVVLDYGDDEGAKNYVLARNQTKLVNWVMEQKTNVEGIWTRKKGGKRRKTRRLTQGKRTRKMRFRG